MRRYEARACARVRLTIAVSDADRRLLAAAAPGARVGAVPTGVDVDYFRPTGRRRCPGRLVFTGLDGLVPERGRHRPLHRAPCCRSIRREVPETDADRGRPQPVASSAGRRRGRPACTSPGLVDDVRPHMARGVGLRRPAARRRRHPAQDLRGALDGQGGRLHDGGRRGAAADAGRALPAGRRSDRVRRGGRRRSCGMPRGAARSGAAGRRLVEERYSWPTRRRRVRNQCVRRCFAMRVSVFGLGYVGCVTAACLARAGHSVVGVDVNAEKVGDDQRGRPRRSSSPGCPSCCARWWGPGGCGRRRRRAGGRRVRSLADLRRHARAARTASSTSTPSIAHRRRASARRCASAPSRTPSCSGARCCRGRPSRTSCRRSSRGAGGRAAMRVAVNPEFMREGSSLNDFARPPLTLVGCGDPATAALLRLLYESVQAPFVHTSIRTAEMAKYAANAFHALKVCFANEIGRRVRRARRRRQRGDAGVRHGPEAQRLRGLPAAGVRVRRLLPAEGPAGAPVRRAARRRVGRRCSRSILPSNEAQVRRGVDAVLASSRRQRIGVVGLVLQGGHRRPAREPDGHPRGDAHRQGL